MKTSADLVNHKLVDQFLDHKNGHVVKSSEFIFEKVTYKEKWYDVVKEVLDH